MKSRLVLLSLVLTLGIGIMTWLHKIIPTFEVDTTMQLLTADICSESFYTINEDNHSAECDLLTLSRIVNNMIDDGYTIKSEEKSDSEIDIILAGNGIKVRLYYTRDGKLVSIAQPYEKSYSALSYIFKENYLKNNYHLKVE